MPHIDESLALDLLNLRDHTQRARDLHDPLRLRASLERSPPISEVVAVRRQNVLAAYAMLQSQNAGQWYVTGFNTHPEHRSAPVFRALFGQLQEIARRRGITSLRSKVHETYCLSKAFRARLGLQTIRENEKRDEFTALVSNLRATSRPDAQ